MRTMQRASGLVRLRPGTCGSFRQSLASCAGVIVSGRGFVAGTFDGGHTHGSSICSPSATWSIGTGVASRAYLGMVTPAFSQAWISAAPAIVPSARAPPHLPSSSAYPQSTPSFRLFTVSKMRCANGSSGVRTDCELDLGRALSCGRKAARGHAGLSASPPSRTGQRRPQHGCRLDEKG